MKLEDFVIETTIYEICCAKCLTRTDEMDCEENAVSEAESMGFEIIGEEVFCSECAGEQ